MEIFSMGINHVHGRHFRISRPMGGGTWLLLLIKTPSFMYLQGQRLELPADALVIYSPGCVQDYGAIGDAYADDWMHFMLDSTDQEILKRHPLPFDTPIILSDTREISDLLRKLCYDFHSRRPFRDEYLEACFRLLVLSIHRKLESLHDTSEGTLVPNSDKLMTLRGYIRSGYYLDRGIDDMARDYCLGRSNLQHLYRRCFGTTIREDQVEARLSIARHYLAATTLSVAEIARTCGYRSESHFMTVFKEKAGMTPSQYRHSR